MDISNITKGMRFCCIKREFRKVVKTMAVDGPTGACVSTHTRCVVCGNNHYLMEVPPVQLGVTGAPI